MYGGGASAATSNGVKVSVNGLSTEKIAATSNGVKVSVNGLSTEKMEIGSNERDVKSKLASAMSVIHPHPCF